MTNDEFRARYATIQNELHKLWTEAVGSPAYDKKQWRALSNAIDQLASDVRKALGHKGPLV